MLKIVNNTVTKSKIVGSRPVRYDSRTFQKGELVQAIQHFRYGKPTYFVDGYFFADWEVTTPNTKQSSSSFAGAEGIGRYHLVGHSLGIAGGIYYSFMKKTGFWKGLGITLIFGIAGGALGMAVDYATKKNNK